MVTEPATPVKMMRQTFCFSRFQGASLGPFFDTLETNSRGAAMADIDWLYDRKS